MKFWELALAATTLSLSFSVNAALVGRLAATEGGTDYQAYYDTEADITWLADANAGGAMSWSEANTWVDSLIVDGKGSWRLPTSDTCQGYNCLSSELGSLFYNALGNTAGSLSNSGPFINIQSDYYWTSTRITVFENSTDYVYAFRMQDGIQSDGWTPWGYSTLAVQSGDVSAVPVPAAVWLFGSGLIGLVGFARRKKA